MARFLLLCAAGGLWFVAHAFGPWFVRAAGAIRNPDVAVLLDHWVFGFPRTVLFVALWLVAWRLELMPPFGASFASGGSWRRVVRTGLVASAVLLLAIVAIGAAFGEFQFRPYFPKMAGDLVSNMYEEIVYRGVFFSAFYGVAAGATFSLEGKLHRSGVVAGTIGSSLVFAASHTQYPLVLRVILAVVSVVFAWTWFAARSLWACWIPHTLADVIGDTIVKL